MQLGAEVLQCGKIPSCMEGAQLAVLQTGDIDMELIMADCGKHIHRQCGDGETHFFQCQPILFDAGLQLALASLTFDVKREIFAQDKTHGPLLFQFA